ncbi:uncharacterized protein LOC117929741 [Vitis riparia]|uniref:uncharacterized protein LOC117929741 n=1 Tax=Vitis riparia TaxID=96939 RepID=UPI00155A12F2|nr:uncharacterized protein LOC117929741 [Vitis riparia]
MGYPSLSLRFAFVLSLSFTASHSSSSPFHLTRTAPPPSPSSFRNLKASASDVVALLGTRQQASQINAEEARQLRSCFKFLVPFTLNSIGLASRGWSIRRRLSLKKGDGRCRREEDELVWWPPAPVLELARLAFDSGGDPAAIHRTLDPTMIRVPDVEGSKEFRCELTRTPYGRRFINEELNSYLEFLFELIAARGPDIGLNASLSRYDFFHGHLFLARETGRLGILFHAKEYPSYEKESFPYNMGYCQIGSNVAYDDSMNLRNILWLAPLPSNSSKGWVAPGVLVVLDARPGGIIYRDIIPDYVKFARTIYEDDFGDVAVDVNYLNVGNAVPDYQIFIC